jgi:hypothetical protein
MFGGDVMTASRSGKRMLSCALALITLPLLGVLTTGARVARAVDPGPSTIQVILTTDRVWNLSDNWGDASGTGTASLTVERNSAPVYGPQTEAISGGAFRFELFPGNSQGRPPIDLQTGDMVTVTDGSGHTAVTSVFALAVDPSYEYTQTVTGTVSPDGTVHMDVINPDSSTCWKEAASSAGTWSITFDCIQFVYPNPLFNVTGSWGGLRVSDPSGNQTFVDWAL